MRHKLNFSVISCSLIFWFIMGLLTVSYNIIAIPLFFVNIHLRHRIIRSWGYIFTILAKIICRVNYQVIGKVTIPGPAILASNHQSMWETIAFNLFFPAHVWILKRELTRIPFFGWALSVLSPIAIDRSNRAASAQQVQTQSRDRVKKGFWIMVFPEGTRVRPDIDAPYKTGVARMALDLNIPIIPITHNAGNVIPKNSFWIYPGLVIVKVGQPIYPTNDTPEILTDKLKNIINTQ